MKPRRRKFRTTAEEKQLFKGIVLLVGLAVTVSLLVVMGVLN